MRTLILILGLALASPVAAESPEDDVSEESEVREATRAAEDWLALVDASEWDASWDEAAALFKQAVTKDQWRQQISGVRPPLGAVVKRTLKSATPKRKLPGAPDGEYVVIQYDTVFANKDTAVETVTPMRDPDGTFRVSGYYIR